MKIDLLDSTDHRGWTPPWDTTNQPTYQQKTHHTILLVSYGKFKLLYLIPIPVPHGRTDVFLYYIYWMSYPGWKKQTIDCSCHGINLFLSVYTTQGRAHKGDSRLGQHANPTKRNIMAAILQSRGPVVTHKVVIWGWKFLKMMSSKQFIGVANDLQDANLGTVMKFQTASRLSFVFIKKPPHEITEALAANLDLCSLEYYTTRYNLPVSKSVPLGIRHQLTSMGLVPYS